MSFFQNLFKPAAPTKPAAPKVAPVPENLPKITAPTAAEIAQTSSPSPAAQQVLAANPQQTPPQYLAALQEKQLGGDMVHTLGHGMSDQDGVNWAAQSAGKVSDKLPPHEVTGMKAAQAWANNPTPENKAAAAAAAAQGGCRGPGSMAAQGAACAQPGTPPAPGTPTAPRLTPHAVSGAVLMASAIQANPAVTVPTMTAPAVAAPTLAAPTLAVPTLSAPTLAVPTPPVPQAPVAPAVVPPQIQAQMFQQQHPFIAMGLNIAAGKAG